MFLPPALIPLFLSMFLTVHVTSQFRLLILVAPPWLITVLNMVVDIPHCHPIKNLVMDVSVGVHGSAITELNLWLLRNVCCGDRCSLP